MNESIEKISGFLFGIEDIHAVKTEEVKQFADEYPYFSIAQLLLAKKLKAEEHFDFHSQLQKTASCFSNPYILHYQLNKSSELNLNLKKKDLNEGLFENTKKHSYLFKAEPDGDKAQVSNQDVKPVLFVDESGLEEKISDNEILIPVPNEQPQEEISTEQNDTGTAPDFPAETTDTDLEIPVRDKIEEVVQETLLPDEQAETTQVLEEMAGAIDNPSPETEAFLNEATDLEKHSGNEDLASLSTSDNIRFPEKSSFFVDSSNKNEPLQDEHDLMFKNIKAMLDATSEEADADVNEAFIPIDPYYTIDYFASQGIKLDLDPNPKDELGQHLKKFTQWLKHMKKLGPEDATEAIARNNETEVDIQKIADSSNTVREVVTEAMASVLEKQGKKDKAIELYNKLSFLNPDKSIYFANKIKSLKGT